VCASAVALGGGRWGVVGGGGGGGGGGDLNIKCVL